MEERIKKRQKFRFKELQVAVAILNPFNGYPMGWYIPCEYYWFVQYSEIIGEAASIPSHDVLTVIKAYQSSHGHWCVTGKREACPTEVCFWQKTKDDDDKADRRLVDIELVV